MAVRLEKVCR